MRSPAVAGTAVFAIVLGWLSPASCLSSIPAGSAGSTAASGSGRKAPVATCPALRIVTQPGLVTLQTSVVSLRPRKDRDGPVVDLISSVHLGEEAYFEELCRRSSKYDRFLYELLAPESAVEVGRDGLLRVTSELQPALGQEIMAQLYGLKAQLSCIDYSKMTRERRNWILADVSSEVLQEWREEYKVPDPTKGLGATASGGLVGTLSEIKQALLVGRISEGNMLPKFFRGSGLDASARAFRALLWLAPCPEAQVLALDWGRSSPPAGGLSSLVSMAVSCVLRGDLATARKLAFAQQLCSNQIDGGAANEQAATSAILVDKRNERVLHSLRRAKQDGCSSVAIMYGALHMKDLQRRLAEDMDLLIDSEHSWVDAWSIIVPQGGMSLNNRASSQQQQSLLILIGGLFLTLGIFDWFETIVSISDMIRGNGIADGATAVSLYVLRHAATYYAMSKWLVQWDKSLLEL